MKDGARLGPLAPRGRARGGRGGERSSTRRSTTTRWPSRTAEPFSNDRRVRGIRGRRWRETAAALSFAARGAGPRLRSSRVKERESLPLTLVVRQRPRRPRRRPPGAGRRVLSVAYAARRSAVRCRPEPQPAGAEPHDVELHPSDVVAIQGSTSCSISAGASTAPSRRRSGRPARTGSTCSRTSGSARPRPGRHAVLDPHVWLDPMRSTRWPDDRRRRSEPAPRLIRSSGAACASTRTVGASRLPRKTHRHEPRGVRLSRVPLRD